MNTNNTSTSSGSNKKNVEQNTQFNSKAYSTQSDSKSEAGFQEKIMVQIRELGDSLERAGEKVERSGWEMIGQAISKLGDSLEHFQEKNQEKRRDSDHDNEKYMGGENAGNRTGSGIVGSGSLSSENRSSENYGDNRNSNGATQASPGFTSPGIKSPKTKVGGNDSQAV